MMKVVIVIPTYNEADNIGELLDALQREIAAIAAEVVLLVVDDSSPDGTAEVVRHRAAAAGNIYLLSGAKQGLGAAYARGFAYALETLGAEVVMEMDADFSHKPEDVPRLIAGIEEGADFVIGSRYVHGGSIPAAWGLWRRLNSRVGNIVARYVAGLWKVKDCTAGFRAIRAGLLSKVDLGSINVQGYAFQIALLHRALVNGGKVVEIPVDFIDRERGESKLGLRDIIEFIVNAWWIRLQSSKTFLKFVIVGASGVVVNLGVFTVLLELGMNKFLASPIAIEVSIISNFFLNNFWTFRRRQTRDAVRIRGLKFNAVSLVALLISYSVFVLSSYVLPTLPAQVHQALGIVPALFVNYFLNSYWTFRHAE
jgi:dolichol-phosphate mannosyltransferase